MLEHSQYSGAQDTLNEVYTILNFYKHVHKELVYESQRTAVNESQMTDHKQVFKVLSEGLDGKVKDTQWGTAKKVLQRYYRNV